MVYAAKQKNVLMLSIATAIVFLFLAATNFSSGKDIVALAHSFAFVAAMVVTVIALKTKSK